MIEHVLAKWIQNYYQQSLSTLFEPHIKKTGIRQVCITGGVGLNSVANTHIQDALGVDVFVPSSPGDAGISIGIGLASVFNKTGILPKIAKTPYWGKVYSNAEIEQDLNAHTADLNWVIKVEAEIMEHCADQLAHDEIVFWFQGRSEFGPRALGHRSILANPKNGWTKDKMNHLIKKREWV